MSILVAHPGTQHAHHLVSGLISRGREVKYNTILYFGNDSRWSGVVPASIYSKRLLKNIPDSVIERHPLLEAIPRVVQTLGMSEQRAYALRNRIFQKRISRRQIHSSSAVIGFDTSSLILARRAEEEEVPFFLEVTSMHPLEKVRWMEFVKDKYPQWPLAITHKPADLIREEDEELSLARVVSAPAAHVKNGYQKHAVKQNLIVVNPFGADIVSFSKKKSYRAQRPTFIFMGAINPLKGIPVLLEAWDLAKPDADLVIGGHGEWPRGVNVPGGVRIAGRIDKHDRESFFHSGDVFLCPSLYEGLAVVQLEAAACGLPVIGTHNSGGAEFLRDGREGFFLEPGNPVALAEKITYFTQNPAACEEMGRGAAERAHQFTWDAYVKRWIDTIDTHTIRP